MPRVGYDRDVESSATLLKSGSNIGSYTILKRLGEGGMALVYLAEHAKLGRLVAIKMLRPELADNVDAVQRFFLEARAVNQIRHPHIVDIIDFCSNPGGEAYYVMEFLEGMDVEQLLARNAITLLRGLEVARQAASSLDAVHDAGIVHRDLKAGNIFVTTDADGNDWVKLLDFGIAKLNHGQGKAIGDSLAGVAAGTPEYMSPEQVMGQDVDHRSDIYSFGVVLYQIVTGQVPFRADTPEETARKHLSASARRPRRLKNVQHRIPPALEALIMHCLEKKPEDRPQSMKEIQPELAMIADMVRYEMMLRSRRVWRLAFAASAVTALVVGSMLTDLRYASRPGASIAALGTAIGRPLGMVAKQTTPVPDALAASVEAPKAPASQPASMPIADAAPAQAANDGAAAAEDAAPSDALTPAEARAEKTHRKRHKRH